MSSNSLSAARHQIWPNQLPFRKQRSFIDGGILSNSSTSVIRSDRGKYSLLQNQFSVDHVYAKGVRPCRVSARRAVDRKPILVSEANNKIQWSNQNPNYEQSDIGLSGIRKDKTVERLKKSKGSEQRINLNIFLAHADSATDNDGVNSDIESSPESLDFPLTKKENREDSVKANLEEQRRAPSAATRRAQFKASKGVQNSNSVGPNALISALPSTLTIERRPPLVRAMSAPVRTLDENSKNIIANKQYRKSRRRRILTRNPSIDKTNVIESSFDENDENNSNRKDQSKSNKKNLGRVKSALGCEVVTLVSLISSEGSDSEKDDPLPAPVEIAVKRAPLLRKTGKSVSFQENVPSNHNKEFPKSLRRGSIAPLAARIRANRPPTAPPVSIFAAEPENNETKMADETENSSKDYSSTTENNAVKNTKADDSNNPKSNSEENTFPEYAKSVKERECWKLFQKMSNKGVSVSYDTILRGMLTPTEFRLIQKQREVEEAKEHSATVAPGTSTEENLDYKQKS